MALFFHWRGSRLSYRDTCPFCFLFCRYPFHCTHRQTSSKMVGNPLPHKQHLPARIEHRLVTLTMLIYIQGRRRNCGCQGSCFKQRWSARH